MNPDGYEYTRSDPSNRFWRKTRSTYSLSLFTQRACYGTDPNRNFPWQWNSPASPSRPRRPLRNGLNGRL